MPLRHGYQDSRERTIDCSRILNPLPRVELQSRNIGDLSPVAAGIRHNLQFPTYLRLRHLCLVIQRRHQPRAGVDLSVSSREKFSEANRQPPMPSC